MVILKKKLVQGIGDVHKSDVIHDLRLISILFNVEYHVNYLVRFEKNNKSLNLKNERSGAQFMQVITIR